MLQMLGAVLALRNKTVSPNWKQVTSESRCCPHLQQQHLINNAATVQLVVPTVRSYLCALLIYNENVLQWNWCLHKNSICITLLLIPGQLSLLMHVINWKHYLCPCLSVSFSLTHTNTSSPCLLCWLTISLSAEFHCKSMDRNSCYWWATVCVCPSWSTPQCEATACTTHIMHTHSICIAIFVRTLTGIMHPLGPYTNLQN